MSQLKETQHLKIPFEVIEEATQNFKTCIGNGGYGSVYKGELLISEQLTAVAVKRLREQLGQGLKEFLTEIELLKSRKHPNLISLIGYCDDRDEKIIIYEYAAHGSLDRYMSPNIDTRKVSWSERLRICVDIARGLSHLHDQGIIHRDIKSANILLDSAWVAKISDLGLSKVSHDAAISYACGTPCYVDPDYMITGIVTKESDVFSFGMVLLEIFCGRLCYVKDEAGNLLSYYHKINKLNKVIDPDLKQHMRPDSLTRFLSIAYGCLRERIKRHSMDRVVRELEDVLKIEKSDVVMRDLLVSSDDPDDSDDLDDSQVWFSEFPFNTYVTRRTNVAKIFDVFDLNKDGGLSKKEVAAFLFVTKDGKEQLSTYIDEVFSLYHKFFDGKRGLTYHGLLQYYEDGHSDLDADVVPLLSNFDDSNKHKKLMWVIEKLSSYKDGGLNGQKLDAPLKTLLQKIVGLPVKVFNWYRKRGLASGSLLTTDDDADIRDQPDFESELLEFLFEPDDDVAAAFSNTPTQREDRVGLLTTNLLILLITLLILPTTIMLVKLKYVVVLFLIVFNSIKVFLNDR